MIVVKGLAVTAYASAYGCGVGCENCADIGKFPAGVQQAHASCPLVKMRKHVLVAQTLVVADAFDDNTGGKCKAACFVVIAVAGRVFRECSIALL